MPYLRIVQPRIDHLFQRRKHDLQKILQDFIHEIAALKGLNELVNKLQTTIASVLYPEHTSIILFDVKSEGLKPFHVSGLPETFSADRHNSFLKWLERTNELAELDLIEADPRYSAVKENAKQYFNDVQGKLVVPLTHDRKLLGVINLGQKKNLKPYTGLDLDFLSHLKVEASIAFSNSLLYDDVSKMSLELKQWATELEHKVEERTKELAESKQEVEKAYTKLKELDAIKTQFFSNISHELRTPLTLVLAPLESMMKGEMGVLPTAQQGHMEIMYQNSLRLLKMINNLLDLAKIDAGKMTLVLDQVNLPEFIKGIVASVSPLAEKKQIRLSFKDGDHLPEVVCDREKIERVLLNLIFNSLKFTEPGGAVTVQCGKVHSKETDGQGDRVMVSVSDTGIGFPKEYSTRIFERFSQVDASASRKHEGTGIGLALAKELVELHNGRIWADSEPGKGTVMTVTLPMDLKVSELEGTAEDRRAARRRARERREGERRQEEDWTRALHTAAEYSAADVLKEAVVVQVPATVPSTPPEHTILLIEDNADMRSFIVFQLQDEFELIQARDGIEGVGLATQHHPDLIISDVMMPGKDGYQVCREIKTDPHTKHIPVILLTAKAELSEKISGLEYGADDYLTKPFNAQELKAKIRSLIQLRRLEREIQHRSEELERTLKMLQETQTQLVHSEKMAALGLLVAGIAHEVNNPVSFAKGSLSNLRRYLGLDRTEGIVTDLKTFARKDEQHTKRVDIQDGLEATIKLIQHEMMSRITVHRDYGIREGVEIIPGQINQVFMNLLQNAIHAIPEKGDIWIRTWEDGDRVHIAVRDSGKGIRKEHLGRIFEPFFTTKEVGQGTGLGLSVSYRIIENHGGKITVSSEEGKGAEFVITLPKRQLPDRPATTNPAGAVAIKGNTR
ncbi:MAG: response regulator [Nitrospirae bacterium]|nr:response regulator [Nitrospirota bacterium]